MRTPGLTGKHPARYPAGSCAGPLQFIHEYLTDPLPPPPPRHYAVPGTVADWGMLGNGPDPTLTVNGGNPVGDCTFAGMVHYQMAKAAAHDETESYETADALVTEYLAYDDGLDVGANMADVLAYWYKAGEILGYAPVDITNRSLIHSALIAFNGIYSGVALSAAAEQQFADGETWAITGTSGDQEVGGHCILQIAYWPTKDEWVTWGTTQISTVAWSHRYRDEGWVVVMREDGIDVARLRSDIEALHGRP